MSLHSLQPALVLEALELSNWNPFEFGLLSATQIWPPGPLWCTKLDSITRKSWSCQKERLPAPLQLNTRASLLAANFHTSTPEDYRSYSTTTKAISGEIITFV